MIDKDTIKKLAALARIEISPEREEQLSQDVSKILDYVEDLKAVNTDGLPEVAQVTGLKNALRKDLSAEALAKEGEPTGATQASPAELLASAPETEDGYIKVKAIFDN